ncbi:MAG: hypothetical protein OEY49_03470 [Candidatus Heimdallarchaeota archaeon]|nr:hypothetical protein [Candidatus Heimdallarchaeota archaeon]
MIKEINKDSFIQSLSTAINKFDETYPIWYFIGASGYGTRISLSMNVKTGKEIGHPTSNYIWDIVNFFHYCVPETGISAKLYIGMGYQTSSRHTAAKGSNLSNSTISFLEYGEFPNIQDKLIYVDHNGNWKYDDHFREIEIETYPFGPIFIEIQAVHKMKYQFPSTTLKYLCDTLERGEEPMEVAGKGSYSCVSGWKAYARWMQSFQIPLIGIQHEYLNFIPIMILERRKAFILYLSELINHLDGDEFNLISQLHQKYQNLLPLLDQLLSAKPTIETVRQLYYTEQKTLSVYKKIANYINRMLS